MTGAPAAYDIFIDLSHAGVAGPALRRHLDRLAHDAGLAPLAGCVTVCTASVELADMRDCGFDVELRSGPAIDVLMRAIRMAARARRHLVILLGDIAPGSEVIAALIEAFAQDPMFGTSQPRFAEPSTDRIWPIPGGEAQRPPLSHRASLPQLAVDTITPELPACCVVLRWELLIGVETSDQHGRTLAGGFLHLLAEGRRLGFRNIVRNRVVLSAPLHVYDIYPTPPIEEIEQLYALDSYAAGTPLLLANLSERRAEMLIEAAHPDANGRRRLLLDCRGMPPLHNGTAVCTLGFLDGFRALTDTWDIHVLAFASTAAFHNFKSRYPAYTHVSDTLAGTYAAALLLSQPWDIGRVAELHRHARAISFLMLDAIAWDIYPNWKGPEAAWGFIAQYADALFYISRFTQDRFNKRFPVAPDVGEAVTHLSLAAEDHARSLPTLEPIANDILIFGNDFHHKHVRPTAQLLSDAFPFHRIMVIGTANIPGSNVTATQSGNIERDTLDRLIAGASVIVFPSFYEGFGLPVVEGLARGRTVLVRRSALWSEIAALSRLPGQMCEFDNPASLVDGVGRALHGLPMTPLPSGVGLAAGEAPADWRACARRASDLLVRQLDGASMQRWRVREHALRIVDQ